MQGFNNSKSILISAKAGEGNGMKLLPAPKSREMRLAELDAFIASMGKSLDVRTLPPTQRKANDVVHLALQSEAVIVEKPTEKDFLYTCGASCCCIVAVVEKHCGAVEKMGLAHIDLATTKESIVGFFSKFGHLSEIYIVGGDADVLRHVVASIPEHSRFRIRMDSNVDGLRSDSLGMRLENGKANLCYGENLVQQDEARLLMNALVIGSTFEKTDLRLTMVGDF